MEFLHQFKFLRFCKHKHVIFQLHSESNTKCSGPEILQPIKTLFYSNNESPHTEHTHSHDIFLNTDRHGNGVINIRMKIEYNIKQWHSAVVLKGFLYEWESVHELAILVCTKQDNSDFRHHLKRNKNQIKILAFI